jgi:hypothetical protein
MLTYQIQTHLNTLQQAGRTLPNHYVIRAALREWQMKGFTARTAEELDRCIREYMGAR